MYEVKSVMQVEILQSKVRKLQHLRFTNVSQVKSYKFEK